MKLLIFVSFIFFVSCLSLQPWKSKQSSERSISSTQSHGQDSGFDDNRLPSEPDDTCPRDQYRKLAQRHGELAVLRIDNSSLADYRLGASQNFDLNCARMYLDMNKLSASSNTYKGFLSIAYDDGKNIKLQRFRSGFSAEENKYNRWSGSTWKADRNNIVSKTFHTIFENKHTALILKMDNVRLKDVRDGDTAYFGAGEIYYKMFRVWTGDKNDLCYRKGTYVSLARQSLPRKNRCWLLGVGPFSCRPNGVLAPRAKVTNIDITRGLSCYKRLGVFFNLNIEGAFNVGNVEEL